MAPTPLTVLTPVPLWWAVWVRFTWMVAAVSGGLLQRPLQALSFIQSAHWSLVGRWPRDPAVAPDRAAPRTLVFLTAFDGSSIPYIDAFVRARPVQIQGLYGGARGFPGPFRFRPVARYIDEHLHPVDHAWTAEPEATTTTIAHALAPPGLFAAFGRRADRRWSDERFAAEWERFLTDVQDFVG